MSEGNAKQIELEIDTGVYSLEAVQAAAYTLTDRAYVRIARSAGAKAVVRLKPKERQDGAGALSDEFYNELLHQALRLKVSQVNQKIREYVVTKALVSAQAPSEPPAAPQAAAPPAADEAPCPECAPQGAAPAVDEELEKEIEKLLVEIEKSDSAGDDPLGVSVPWEEKHGAKAGAGAASGGKAQGVTAQDATAQDATTQDATTQGAAAQDAAIQDAAAQDGGKSS